MKETWHGPLPPWCTEQGPPPDSCVLSGAQGDGVPPSEAREFCDWLSGSSAPKLPSTAFSVCALGDT